MIILKYIGGVSMKKAVKKSENIELMYQFKPLTVCPLPARIKKIDIVYNKSKRPAIEGYEPYWEKKTGDQYVKIIANPHYGFPHGQDILVILYLMKAAIDHNKDGLIEFKSIYDYLKTFNIDTGDKSSKAAIKAFKRIFYATWFWESKRTGNEQAISFRIIDSWNVWFDKEMPSQNPLFKSFIKLSPAAWQILKTHPIPCKLDAVCSLKGTPTALSLYLLLVYRTWHNFHNEKKEAFIPFFGENGLQFQLSSGIDKAKHFRQKINHWIDQIKEVWPDAPFYFKHETDPDRMGKNKKKIYQDGLFINVKNVNQLHVDPHWDKMLRQAQEQSAETNFKAIEAKKEVLAKNYGLSEKQRKFIERFGDSETIERMKKDELSQGEASFYIASITNAWE
jgi:hypothetical protein